MGSRLAHWLVNWACRNRLIIVLLSALMVVASLAYVATHFEMTTDTAALISPGVEWREQEAVIDRAFPQRGDNTLVVIDGATPELAEMAAAKLAERLSTDHVHFRGANRPDGGEFFTREGLLFASLPEVSAATQRMVAAQPFLGPLAADPSLRGVASALSTMLEGVSRGAGRLDDIARPMAALADALPPGKPPKPFSWQRLIGGEGGALAAPSRRLVLALPRLDFGTLKPGEMASGAIRRAATELRLDQAHGIHVGLTGAVPLADEEFASLEHRAWLVGTTMFAAMLLTLWLALRSKRIVAAIMLTTIAGLFITMALGLFVVGRFNLISVAFIPLFVGLGIDFGIQIGVRYRAELMQEEDRTAAVCAAAIALGPSLLLAAGAICLGFLAFLPTAYVGVAELGIIAALGMVVALLLAMTLLPAILMLMRRPMARHEPPTEWLGRLDRGLITHRRYVLLAFGVAMIASLASLAFVRFDFNPLHLRDPKGEAMATLNGLMSDPDLTPNTIDVLAPNLAAAQALKAKLVKLPEVRRAITLQDFIPTDQPAKLAAISDAQLLLGPSIDPFGTLPSPSDEETRAALAGTAAKLRSAAAGRPASDPAIRLAASFAALAQGTPADRARAAEAIVPPLNVTLDQLRLTLQAQPVGIADLPKSLVGDWLTADGRARIQLFPEGGADNTALRHFTRAVRAVAPTASGLPISTQEAARTIADAFVQAGILALVAVALLLLAVLRSLRETAFTLAPVVLSGFLTLGSCVLIGQPINFANIIAFPLLFGVGVAFHIYFVMAWRAGARDLLQSSLARAVFFSALATGTAFGSLWISSHPGTASMGKILMISLAWTLVCALIFEPALLGPPRKAVSER